MSSLSKDGWLRDKSDDLNLSYKNYCPEEQIKDKITQAVICREIDTVIRDNLSHFPISIKNYKSCNKPQDKGKIP